MNYRLLAIDLDGTLLDSRGNLPEANRKALARAESAGLRVVLCTGRGLAETQSVIQAIGHQGPLILACGAQIADGATGRTIHRVLLPPDLAGAVVDHLDTGQHAVLVLTDPHPAGFDYLVVAEMNLTQNTRWWFERVAARLRCVDKASSADLDHALRVAVVGPASAMALLLRSVRETFGPDVMAQHFGAVTANGEDAHVLEVFARGVSKWSGLTWLAAREGVETRQIVSIGDNINDLTMLEAAGCSIAMANAHPAALAAANHMTTSNDESGVAAAIENLLSGKW